MVLERKCAHFFAATRFWSGEEQGGKKEETRPEGGKLLS